MDSDIKPNCPRAYLKPHIRIHVVRPPNAMPGEHFMFPLKADAENLTERILKGIDHTHPMCALPHSSDPDPEPSGWVFDLYVIQARAGNYTFRSKGGRGRLDNARFETVASIDGEGAGGTYIVALKRDLTIPNSPRQILNDQERKGEFAWELECEAIRAQMRESFPLPVVFALYFGLRQRFHNACTLPPELNHRCLPTMVAYATVD